MKLHVRRYYKHQTEITFCYIYPSCIFLTEIHELRWCCTCLVSLSVYCFICTILYSALLFEFALLCICVAVAKWWTDKAASICFIVSEIRMCHPSFLSLLRTIRTSFSTFSLTDVFVLYKWCFGVDSLGEKTKLYISYTCPRFCRPLFCIKHSWTNLVDKMEDEELAVVSCTSALLGMSRSSSSFSGPIPVTMLR